MNQVQKQTVAMLVGMLRRVTDEWDDAACEEAFEVLARELEAGTRLRLRRYAGSLHCAAAGHDWTDHEPEGADAPRCSRCGIPMPHADGIGKAHT